MILRCKPVEEQNAKMDQAIKNSLMDETKNLWNEYFFEKSISKEEYNEKITEWNSRWIAAGGHPGSTRVLQK